MLENNLIRMYEKSFRANGELPALSDYFSKERFTCFQMAQQIARLHMLFTEAHIHPGEQDRAHRAGYLPPGHDLHRCYLLRSY